MAGLTDGMTNNSMLHSPKQVLSPHLHQKQKSKNDKNKTKTKDKRKKVEAQKKEKAEKTEKEEEKESDRTIETISYHMTTLDDNEEKPPPKYPSNKSCINVENHVQSALTSNQELVDFAQEGVQMFNSTNTDVNTSKNNKEGGP